MVDSLLERYQASAAIWKSTEYGYKSIKYRDYDLIVMELKDESGVTKAYVSLFAVVAILTKKLDGYVKTSALPYATGFDKLIYLNDPDWMRRHHIITKKYQKEGDLQTAHKLTRIQEGYGPKEDINNKNLYKKNVMLLELCGTTVDQAISHVCIGDKALPLYTDTDGESFENELEELIKLKPKIYCAPTKTQEKPLKEKKTPEKPDRLTSLFRPKKRIKCPHQNTVYQDPLSVPMKATFINDHVAAMETGICLLKAIPANIRKGFESKQVHQNYLYDQDHKDYKACINPECTKCLAINRQLNNLIKFQEQPPEDDEDDENEYDEDEWTQEEAVEAKKIISDLCGAERAKQLENKLVWTKGKRRSRLIGTIRNYEELKRFMKWVVMVFSANDLLEKCNEPDILIVLTPSFYELVLMYITHVSANTKVQDNTAAKKVTAVMSVIDGIRHRVVMQLPNKAQQDEWDYRLIKTTDKLIELRKKFQKSPKQKGSLGGLPAVIGKKSPPIEIMVMAHSWLRDHFCKVDNLMKLSVQELHYINQKITYLGLAPRGLGHRNGEYASFSGNCLFTGKELLAHKGTDYLNDPMAFGRLKIQNLLSFLPEDQKWKVNHYVVAIRDEKLAESKRSAWKVTIIPFEAEISGIFHDFAARELLLANKMRKETNPDREWVENYCTAYLTIREQDGYSSDSLWALLEVYGYTPLELWKRHQRNARVFRPFDCGRKYREGRTKEAVTENAKCSSWITKLLKEGMFWFFDSVGNLDEIFSIGENWVREDKNIRKMCDNYTNTWVRHAIIERFMELGVPKELQDVFSDQVSMHTYITRTQVYQNISKFFQIMSFRKFLDGGMLTSDESLRLMSQGIIELQAPTHTTKINQEHVNAILKHTKAKQKRKDIQKAMKQHKIPCRNLKEDRTLADISEYVSKIEREEEMEDRGIEDQPEPEPECVVDHASMKDRFTQLMGVKRRALEDMARQTCSEPPPVESEDDEPPPLEDTAIADMGSRIEELMPLRVENDPDQFKKGMKWCAEVEGKLYEVICIKKNDLTLKVLDKDLVETTMIMTKEDAIDQYDRYFTSPMDPEESFRIYGNNTYGLDGKKRKKKQKTYDNDFDLA